MRSIRSHTVARSSRSLTLAACGRGLAVLGLAIASMATVTNASASDVWQPTVVSQNPANFTPRLVPNGDRPHANAVAQAGSRMFVGGLFNTVSDGRGQQRYSRANLVIFNANTGAVSSDAPSFNREVWAVESYGNAVYVGGTFTTVDGITRRRLVKLDADTGQVDTSFNARLRGGRVLDLHMYTGPAGPMLFVAGAAGKKLMALDPATGRDTGYVDLNINTEVPRAFGGVSVNNFAINPAGTKLVAVGNFTKVGAADRARAFMADLGPTRAAGATLSNWYYEPFEEVCNSTRPRRLAYLTDVDFAPNGSYFIFGATGHTPAPGDHGKTVCDAAARFETNGPNRPFRPTWINYTGGDTIWSVVASGAAVYVQGHFQWLDNFRGVGDNVNPNAVRRLGIGAIDPDSGKALPWAPRKPARQGGKQLLTTPTGLWVVSDSKRFDGEPRYGIAFAPLP